MDHKEFSNLLDALPEGKLTDEQKQRMDAHARECPACRARALMLKDLRTMDAETEAPEAFSQAWREKIREEEKMEKKQQKKRIP